MIDIMDRLRFDAVRCEAQFSKGVAGNIDEAADEIERLRTGLEAAIRAAKLALFVIRKQGVMPNSSWESGFDGDLKTAEAALARRQSAPSL